MVALNSCQLIFVNCQFIFLTLTLQIIEEINEYDNLCVKLNTCSIKNSPS